MSKSQGKRVDIQNSSSAKISNSSKNWAPGPSGRSTSRKIGPIAANDLLPNSRRSAPNSPSSTTRPKYTSTSPPSGP